MMISLTVLQSLVLGAVSWRCCCRARFVSLSKMAILMESGMLTVFSLSYQSTSNSHDAKASSKRCSSKDGFRSLVR